ncbi:MAG: hypothetical protein PF489_12790 [Salinivirgaceae bacterium]|jgi:hypothetical protein|nr:hypothetical protein [Salinivirgaceae bacterium]
MLPNNEYTIYKFRIKQFIDEMTKRDADRAFKLLPSLLCMHEKSFSRLVNTKADSTYEPSADKILKLASFFNCTPYEIYYNPPQKVTIKDIYIHQNKELIKDLSLKPIQS